MTTGNRTFISRRRKCSNSSCGRSHSRIAAARVSEVGTIPSRTNARNASKHCCRRVWGLVEYTAACVRRRKRNQRQTFDNAFEATLSKFWLKEEFFRRPQTVEEILEEGSTGSILERVEKALIAYRSAVIEQKL